MTTLIVDNEPAVRSELRSMLQAYDDIDVVDEAASADEAIEKMQLRQPELLFLDIQMPGFDILQQSDPHPHIIFISSCCELALKAFEMNALDYLLKPIVAKRLNETILKIRNEVNRVYAVSSYEHEHKSILTDSDSVFVKDGENCWFIKLCEVRLFESVGNYAKVFFGENKPLILKSLNALEERLDNRIFFRANRKHIINLRWVDKIEPYFNGGLLLGIKSGGEKIEVSRRQAIKLKEAKSL